MRSSTVAHRPRPGRGRVWLAALVLACGPDGVGDAPTPDAARADEIVVAAPADTYGTVVGNELGMYPVNTNIFEPLVRLTAEYRVEPLLAERWELIEPNTWRFHLRRGVRFHDGTPLTAEAVVWTIRRVARTGGGTLAVDEESAVAVDSFTVDITPARPNRRLVEQLVHPSLGIIAPGTEPGEDAVGTGPYRLVEYARDDRIVVERHDGYWGAPPRTGRLVFRFIPDGNTRVLALRAGEVSLAYDIPREAIPELERQDGVRVLRSDVGGYETLYVSLHAPPPFELGGRDEIRRALSFAIDRDEIVRVGWPGAARPGGSVVMRPLLAGRDAVEGMPYDPDRAARTLEEAGWTAGPDGVREKDGRRLELTLVVGFPTPEVHRPLPELVQAQFARVGIGLRIVRVADNASYHARVGAMQGDLWVEAGGQNDANPCFIPDLIFYGGGPTGAASNYGALLGPGPRYDRFIETCRSADIEAAREAATRAVQLLVREEHVVLPIASIFRLWGADADVRDFVPHPSNLSQRWDRVWLER